MASSRSIRCHMTWVGTMSRTASRVTTAVVEGHAVADPPALVVAGDREGAEAELGHDLDHVEGHDPLE